MSFENLDGAEVKMSARGGTTVLVSIEPGFLRDSLITMLQSFHFVSVVAGTPGGDHGLPRPCPSQPLIVVIKSSPNRPDRYEFLDSLRKANPKNKCLAIVDTLHTDKRALECGADAVITTGFTSQELAPVIQRLAHLQQGDCFPAGEERAAPSEKNV